MRHIKVLSVSKERVDKYLSLWEKLGEVEIVRGVEGSIAQAHYNLTTLALSEFWDENVVVFQDDVTPVNELPNHVGEITAYGTRISSRHVCPHAFSATMQGWTTLRRAWAWVPPTYPRFGGVMCGRWNPDHVYEGVVTHMEPRAS